nr:hypothetical protein [uncultured Prevotella sp.]
MKSKIAYFFMLILCCASVHAQQVHLGPLHSSDNPREDWLLPGDTIFQAEQPLIYKGKPVKNTQYSVAKKSLMALAPFQDTDSKSMYAGDRSVYAGDSSFFYNPVSMMPFSTYGYGLHRGLNVSLDLSAFATFGKNLPHKGGFSQNINTTYLAPLTKDGKLWIAGGGYFNNTFWGSDSYRDVGLYAILGYRFNEHWEAYVYGQLSVNNNYSRYGNLYRAYPYYGWGWPATGVMPLGYGMGAAGANVLGAGVKYNVNKNFSIGLNVEGIWYNNKTPVYFDQYNYPGRTD